MDMSLIAVIVSNFLALGKHYVSVLQGAVLLLSAKTHTQVNVYHVSPPNNVLTVGV